MKNINNIIQNSLEGDNSFINLRINLDQVDDFIHDQKISEIIELVKQSFPFTFIGRQKIRRIIDKLEFAFWIKDPHKKYVIVNNIFAEAVGLNLNKIEGQHLKDVLIESEAKLLSSVDDYIINSSNSVVYETYSKTFSKQTNQNIEFPICDMDKKVIAIIGFNQIVDDTKSVGEKEAIIVIQGAINTQNVVVVCFEFGFMGGSMGASVGEKFVRGVNAAIENQCPLICFSASGGARMQEGLFSLMQMAKTSASLGRFAQQKLPYISVLTDPTMGGVSASFATLGDIIIAEPKALIGFAGPRVIEQTVRQVLPDGFQRSEFLMKHGHIDMIVERSEMKSTLARIMSNLMKNRIKL